MRSPPRPRRCRRRCCAWCSSARSVILSCPTLCRSSRLPTRPIRRLTDGRSRRRWPIASAIWTGMSTPPPLRRGSRAGGPLPPAPPRPPDGEDAPGWPAPAVASVPDRWEDRLAVARAWVAGFLTVRPMLALAVPDDAAAAGRAWPSPRSWEMAARLQCAALAAGADELVVSLLVRGCVGPGAGVEFLTWLQE